LAGAAEPPAAGKPAAEATGAAAQQPFATVGKTVIGVAEYDLAFAQAQRQRFYHRQAPEHERQALRREVGDSLINRVLLLEEVGRRGIQPDPAKIEATVAGYEKQYANSPQWPRIKAEMLPALVKELERQSTLERLESQVRETGEPTESQLRAFYQQNQALFTEPAKQRIALILLKVDPSSAQPVWDSAMEEAKGIRERLLKGADFAEAARLHSGDESAAKGGDMGFMHRGAIAEHVAQYLDKLSLGEVAEPIQLLEGIGLFRVVERVEPQLHPLSSVQARATQLWKREQGEQAWKALIERLRAGSSISIGDPSRYPDLASTVPPQPAAR
jgi:peptidyl-prolyl cis-trans isomerase C